MPGAIALLKQAIAADPEWASPELGVRGAAGRASPSRWRRRAGTPQRALDLAEEEDEYLSALALKAGLEAELGESRRPGGRWPSCRRPRSRWAIRTLALEIADLHLALGDAELARERLRTLTGGEPGRVGRRVARARLRRGGAGGRRRDARRLEADLDARLRAGRAARTTERPG